MAARLIMDTQHHGGQMIGGFFGWPGANVDAIGFFAPQRPVGEWRAQSFRLSTRVFALAPLAFPVEQGWRGSTILRFPDWRCEAVVLHSFGNP
jgi:hypothetical protein